MRTLLPLLLALLLGTLAAHAGRTTIAPARLLAAPAPPAAAQAPTPPDTAAALHHLFERKRRERRRAVFITMGVGTVLAGGAVLDAGHQSDGLAIGLDYLLAIMCGVVVGGVVLGCLIAFDRYSRLHERRALNWLRYHMLPADLVRELEPQDFEAPPIF